MSLGATATDADGTIAKVDFYAGELSSVRTRRARYAFNWTGVGAGTYTLKAVATDNAGASHDLGHADGHGVGTQRGADGVDDDRQEQLHGAGVGGDDGGGGG